MPQFAECLVFEWGWGFFAFLTITFIVIVGLLLFLAWFLGLHRPTSRADEIVYDKTTVRGAIARLAFIIVVIGAIGYGLYWGYDKARTSFEVSFNTTSAPADLEKLRNKFQPDTQATITIGDRAKNFSVSGKFKGVCVEDLFESICRHYNDQIVCRSSKFGRSVAIDMR
jgi:hypothetical protein